MSTVHGHSESLGARALLGYKICRFDEAFVIAISMLTVSIFYQQWNFHCSYWNKHILGAAGGPDKGGPGAGGDGGPRGLLLVYCRVRGTFAVESVNLTKTQSEGRWKKGFQTELEMTWKSLDFNIFSIPQAAAAAAMRADLASVDPMILDFWDFDVFRWCLNVRHWMLFSQGRICLPVFWAKFLLCWVSYGKMTCMLSYTFYRYHPLDESDTWSKSAAWSTRRAYIGE